MINNISYTNIREILDNLLQHDLLQDITLEQMVGYVIRFNGLFNAPNLYTEKSVFIDIEDYRGALPCDLVSVKQVRECKSNVSLRQISGTFFNPHSFEFAFKTQGRVIYTTFKEGKIEVVYLAVPVDEEGYPLILDNEKYKRALELYIKKDKFTKFFDSNKISQNVLQNVQQEYAWAAGALHAELMTPSLSEMESISNAHNQLLAKTEEFKKGFETLGITEHYKRH